MLLGYRDEWSRSTPWLASVTVTSLRAEQVFEAYAKEGCCWRSGISCWRDRLQGFHWFEISIYLTHVVVIIPPECCQPLLPICGLSRGLSILNQDTPPTPGEDNTVDQVGKRFYLSEPRSPNMTFPNNLDLSAPRSRISKQDVDTVLVRAPFSNLSTWRDGRAYERVPGQFEGTEFAN